MNLNYKCLFLLAFFFISLASLASEPTFVPDLIKSVRIVPSSSPNNTGGYVCPSMYVSWAPSNNRLYYVIIYKANKEKTSFIIDDYGHGSLKYDQYTAYDDAPQSALRFTVNSSYLESNDILFAGHVSSSSFSYTFNQAVIPDHSNYTIQIIAYSAFSSGYNGDYHWRISYGSYKTTVTTDFTKPIPPVDFLSMLNIFSRIDDTFYTNNRTIQFQYSPFSDGNGSGMAAHVLYENINQSWMFVGSFLPQSSTISITKEADGIYNYRVKGIDRVQNSTDSDICSVCVDTKPPEIQSFSPYINGNNIDQTTLVSRVPVDIRLAIKAPDQNTESPIPGPHIWRIEKTIDSVTEVVTENSSNLSYPLNEPGNYKVTVTIRDLAGNSTTSNTLDVTIDRTAPVVEAPTLSFGYNSSSKISQINLGWERPVDSSDIEVYTVFYRRRSLGGTNGFGNFSQVPAQNVDVDMCTAFLDLSGDLFVRGEAEEIQFTVLAVDSLGNTGDPIEGNKTTIILPAKVKSSITGSSYDSGTGLISVAVDFNITRAQAIRDYEQLILVRSACDGNTALPAESALPREIVILNSDFGTRLTDSGTGCSLIDQMPAASGVGHKFLKYQVYGIPKGQTTRERYEDTEEHLLPNTPGRILWSLIDTAGEVLEFDASGQVVTLNPAFRINADGLVNVRFKGEDLDKETWMIDLYHSRRVHASPPIISNTPVSPTSFREYDTALSPDETYPVYLQGGVNSLLFKWIEGNVQDGGVPGANWAENRSSLFTLELELMQSGQYRITITNEYAESGQDWITVQPGEPLTMEVEAEDGSDFSCDWDFGDGETAIGPSAEHTYDQREDEMSDTSRYTLTIRLTDSNASETTIPLAIRVLDTQVGQLYVSETWRGDHRVIGVVTVPSGLTLTVGDEALQGAMKVTFVGNIGSGYMQGIEVLSGGALVVDNSGHTVTFSDGLAGNGWGTIFIGEGAAADIRDALFSDADRALTIAGGATASIRDSIFTDNTTAIHVFGSSSVEIISCQIIGSRLYGIKEEQSANPVLTGNTLRDNFRPYYRWDGGLLSISEINALPNNTGNKEE